MNISELMEQYVNATIQYEKLQQIVETEHDNYMHAMARSTDVWEEDPNYGLKQSKAAAQFLKSEEAAKKEFDSAKKILDFLHQSYMMACDSMTSYDAMQNHSIAEKKYLALKEEYDGLSELRESSNRTGKKYDQDYGYSKAAPFYSKGTECYSKMREIEPIMRVYKGFSINLKVLAEKKQNDEYGPKSPKNR